MNDSCATKIGIVLPAFNEELSLKNSVEEILHWQPPSGSIFHELLVIDDGSSDQTAKIINTISENEAKVKLIQNSQNRGKGYSVRRGLLESTSDICGFTDADLAYGTEYFSSFVEIIAKRNADYVIGSRRLIPKTGYKEYSFSRRASTSVFKMIVNALGLTDVSDSQCGIKFFNRRTIESIIPQLIQDGFTFDVEMLYLARRYNLHVVEFPVEMKPQRPSKIQLRKESLAMLLDLIKIRFHKYQ